VEVHLYSLSRLHIVHRDFTFLLDTHTVLSLGTCFPASFRPELISRDSRAHRAVFPLRLHQQSRKFHHRCSRIPNFHCTAFHLKCLSFSMNYHYFVDFISRIRNYCVRHVLDEIKGTNCEQITSVCPFASCDLV